VGELAQAASDVATRAVNTKVDSFRILPIARAKCLPAVPVPAKAQAASRYDRGVSGS
jgi:hypothetical protein